MCISTPSPIDFFKVRLVVHGTKALVGRHGPAVQAAEEHLDPLRHGLGPAVEALVAASKTCTLHICVHIDRVLNRHIYISLTFYSYRYI